MQVLATTLMVNFNHTPCRLNKMYEDHPSEEYEQIDMDPSGVPLLVGSPAHGMTPAESVGVMMSPSRRPPMPLPGSAPSLQSM